MFKNFLIPIALFVTIFFINVAHADHIHQDSFYRDWGQYDYANSRWSLVECLCGVGPATVRGGGKSIGDKSVGDTTFTVSKTVTNQTNLTWTGYILMLDPVASATFGMGTISSTVFKTSKYPVSKTIEPYEPNTVGLLYLRGTGFDRSKVIIPN